MAVVSAVELPASGGNNARGYFEFTRRWLVVTDDPHDGPYTASDFPGHPTYGDGYGSGNDLFPGAVLYDFRMEPVDGQLLHWIATCKYSNEPQETGSGNIGNNDGTLTDAPTNPSQTAGGTAPEDRMFANLKFTSREFTEIVSKDQAGNPVVNKAGQQIPLEIRKFHPVISFTRWLPISVSADTVFSRAELLTGSVNYDSFLGFAPKTLLCTEWLPTTKFDNGSYCWEVSVSLELNRDGWNPVLALNAGTLAKDGGGEFKQVTDSGGQPISDAMPLDPDGYQLEVGGTINYCEFQGYFETNFTGVV